MPRPLVKFEAADQALKLRSKGKRCVAPLLLLPRHLSGFHVAGVCSSIFLCTITRILTSARSSPTQKEGIRQIIMIRLAFLPPSPSDCPTLSHPGAVPSCMRDQTWDARPFPDNCKTRVGWTLLNRSNSAEYTIGFLRKSSRVFNVLVKHPQDHLGQRVELCLILITVSPRLRSCPIS
jgi:hypothetical protein